MSGKPRVVVLLPTYDEAENIEPLARELLGLAVPGLEVCVVDDGSPDGTGKIVEDLSARAPGVRLLSRAGLPRGRGLAGRDGFLDALARGAEFIVEMDADFSHQPRHLPDLLEALKSCDVAVGSRLSRGGGDDRGPSRRILSSLANAYARVLLGLPIRDVDSGYRAFTRAALESIEPRTLRSRGPSIIHEFLFRASRRGLRVREIPIAFVDRKKGDSKLDWRKLASGCLFVLRLRALGSR